MPLKGFIEITLNTLGVLLLSLNMITINIKHYFEWTKHFVSPVSRRHLLGIESHCIHIILFILSLFSCMITSRSIDTSAHLLTPDTHLRGYHKNQSSHSHALTYMTCLGLTNLCAAT